MGAGSQDKNRYIWCCGNIHRKIGWPMSIEVCFNQLRFPQHPVISRWRQYCSCYPRCRTAVTIVVGLGICHAIVQVVRGAGAVVADTVVLAVEVEVEAEVAVVATRATTVGSQGIWPGTV
ncbi:hypothetical protein CRM22_001926 [Opisthorchis felineus]|uniref:Uncharacterized protein n=1 Tax=Opisthorchis felineus TaxID=147828 RepID=A0A4S2M8D5_OPIFE|nr:hypothetical protein CRM22_001926 [Opisthorchis felineus]